MNTFVAGGSGVSRRVVLMLIPHAMIATLQRHLYCQAAVDPAHVFGLALYWSRPHDENEQCLQSVDRIMTDHHKIPKKGW